MAQKYPIGIETFSNIIESGYTYVDKTEEIYRLISTGKNFFLSRPRRFGKSLMLSTMEAYFEGRRELFKGLWLDRDDVDWTPRPVFRLNFVSASPTAKGINSLLESHLRAWERRYSCSAEDLDYSQRFRTVIEKAHEVTGRKVVVLIDEYDKVLVNTLHQPELNEELKTVLKPIFSVLKGADAHITFGMLTGVSRFSKLSVFSDLNNLVDITLDHRFCTICGFTEDEIRHTFTEGIADFAVKNEMNFDEAMALLKMHYDGYHFSGECPDIYNPFSLLGALSRHNITHSWFESGTPTFLVKMMQHTNQDVRTLLGPETTASMLSSNDTMHTDLTAVLFQTGYLTIKGYDRKLGLYQLGVPNKEVEDGLMNCLLPQYSGRNRGESESTVIQLMRHAQRGEAEEMMELLQSFLADIPYDLSRNKPEIYFENNLYIIFKLVGIYVQTEYRTSRGRIDILLQTSDYIYVMELKLDGSPEEALAQIANKDYPLAFSADGRTVIRIGINFSKQKRNIDRWRIVPR